jgi:hypothetical protein
MPDDQADVQALLAEVARLLERLHAVEAKAAELLSENTALHDLVALRESLSEILSAHAPKSWSRRAVIDAEKRRVEQMTAALRDAIDQGDAHAMADALYVIYRHAPATVPPQVLRVNLPRGPRQKVSASVIARIEREYSGKPDKVLISEIMNACDVGHTTAWRALNWWRMLKRSEYKAVVDKDLDGRLVFVVLPGGPCGDGDISR